MTDNADKTRIAPHIPSELYVRLCHHVGTGSGAMSRFCIDAIERELERAKVPEPQ